MLNREPHLWVIEIQDKNGWIPSGWIEKRRKDARGVKKVFFQEGGIPARVKKYSQVAESR